MTTKVEHTAPRSNRLHVFGVQKLSHNMVKHWLVVPSLQFRMKLEDEEGPIEKGLSIPITEYCALLQRDFIQFCLVQVLILTINAWNRMLSGSKTKHLFLGWLVNDRVLLALRFFAFSTRDFHFFRFAAS